MKIKLLVGSFVICSFFYACNDEANMPVDDPNKVVKGLVDENFEPTTTAYTFRIERSWRK